MALLPFGAAPTPNATSTKRGKVQLATGAETVTGTDAVKVITPADLTAKIDQDGTLAADSPNLIPSQAAVKDYVDDNSQGLIVHTAADYATTAALPAIIYANGSSGVGATLTGVSVGALAIDSAAPTVGQRILVKDQVSQFQNGIYTVTATGSGIAVFVMTRATDLDTATEVPHAYVFISFGTANDRTSWSVRDPGPYTMGTTVIVWNQFFAAGEIDPGTALAQVGNAFNVQVDNSTIEVNSNNLRVKAGGITANELASTTVVAGSYTVNGQALFTTDGDGRLTAATNATITVTAPTQRTFITAMGF